MASVRKADGACTVITRAGWHDPEGQVVVQGCLQPQMDSAVTTACNQRLSVGDFQQRAFGPRGVWFIDQSDAVARVP